ncbi:hypothetical protein N0V93_008187 [Gnomoniopsis smithogilvyi]|uniref:Uncharacterized protein n=1 Tax=Gnomoniopsis smithogilvyi TaxID=1191159 RepID=A0A9W8YLI1_9PEZI|nr:hypothetical protein N0V93_008187 [Gnomoniopsis smithogilvyi]
MAEPKRKVLITGCSDGSLGAGLASALHKAGLHVYATSRNTEKMAKLAALGIEILELDVLSSSSITACAAKIPELDILINNAGANYTMPIADLKISDAKQLFDLNVWSYIAVTQAFLPVLLKSTRGAIIANQTSAAGLMPIPWQATYNASKAAISAFSDTMRLELEVFGIKVIDLKTSLVKSNMVSDVKRVGPNLPEGSIYEPAREVLESALRGDQFVGGGQDQVEWADSVLKELLKEEPPLVIYTGENADMTPQLSNKPGQIDEMVKSWTQLDKVEAILKQSKV